jgi:hypothetical protein
MRLALAAALFFAAGGVALPAPRAAPEVEDDYPRALEAARDEGKLLFVDAWAPW